MIGVKDLMVGNYLKWENNDSVFELTLGVFCDKYYQYHLSKGDIIPIPLTEEILVKCGFKELGRYTFYSSTFKIHKRKRGFVIRKSIPIIDYLHQLQIAYKVFTGKELEVKL